MARVPLALTLAAALCLAVPAAAQTARAMGTVRDTDGKPIKGATIRASNPDAHPPQMVSTTDDRGRWAMIGLRIGTYAFVVEAPGFLPVSADAPVRTAASAPLQFTLARDPGPIPGALPANIQAQIAAANMLRDQGRLDQALSVYQEIRAKHPKLTAVNLVLGSLYHQRAAQESDAALRADLLTRAIQSVEAALAADAGNARAKRQLDALRAEAGTAVR
jgi:type VI protein secretion system component VasK